MKTNQINQINFSGLHIEKSAYKQLECSDRTFLNNPNIRDCADKFEVVVKKGKKIGSREPHIMKQLLGGSIASIIGISLPTLYNLYVQSAENLVTAIPSFWTSFWSGVGCMGAFMASYLTSSNKMLLLYSAFAFFKQCEQPTVQPLNKFKVSNLLVMKLIASIFNGFLPLNKQISLCTPSKFCRFNLVKGYLLSLIELGILLICVLISDISFIKYIKKRKNIFC